MDDAQFEQLSAEILDGRVPDWEALELATPPDKRARLDALRSVARIAAASREAVGNRQPERWGGFELIEPVGHGGYGEVWRAYDPQLDRYVALKLVPAEDDEEAHDVLREGRLLARVRHPNVAAVYGASRIDREIGVAMEYVGGDDLDARVRRHGPIPQREVLAIGLQLARALEAVHGAGVLHRDIKASNVKCSDDGRAILLDFGSSRELRSRSNAPAAEAGTPLYLAPEVLRGGTATIQADLYSLGVLLYYLATGKYPVSASSIEDLRSAHELRKTKREAKFDARVRRALARVLDELLSPDPDLRPRSATDVVARLSPRRYRYAIGIGAGVLAVIVAAALGLRLLARFNSDVPGTVRTLEFTIAPSTVGRPSSDGRILPFVDRRSGGLAVLHVDSGAIDLLMTDADIRERFTGAVVASPDGRKVAYQWHGDAVPGDELRVIDLSSHTTTVLWRTSAGTEIKPTAWSHDGLMIAGVVRQEDGRQSLFTIRPGAAATVIEAAGAALPAFSDDSRFLVFQTPDAKTHLSALWAIELSSGTPRRLHIEGSNDSSPIWHDGHLVFVSERGGAAAVWAVRMNADRGDADGVPRRVNGTEEVVELLAMTDNGSLICRRQEGNAQVFISKLDGSSVEPISTGPGAHVSPDWSPDGTRIAYISEPPTGAVRHILRIRDLRTGREELFDTLGRSFGTPGRIGVNPRFSPDGSRMILRHLQGGFFVVDLRTAVESREFAKGRQYADVEWDDDTHVFFLERDRGISRLDLTTNEEEQLYSLPPGAVMGRGITVTPDKSRIGFVVVDGTRSERSTIMVMNRDGSAAQELLSRTKQDGAVPFFAAVPLLLGEWTPDGAMILFAATDVLPSGFTRWNTDLWSVPGTGGPAQRTGLNVAGLRDVRPEPHGTRVAYTSFTNHLETLILQGALRDADAVR